MLLCFGLDELSIMLMGLLGADRNGVKAKGQDVMKVCTVKPQSTTTIHSKRLAEKRFVRILN